MQKAIYSKNITLVFPTAETAAPAAMPRRRNILRWLSRKWDLIAILALMGSSAAYCLYALSHLGM